jgi:hypothetical protein
MKSALWLGLAFVLIGLPQFRAPFMTSASHERQNQTVGLELSANQGFGGFWREPRVPFSVASAPELPFSGLRYEFPFPALLATVARKASWPEGWSFYVLLSMLCSLSGSWCLILVLRHWSVPEVSSRAAAALWLFSPLVLHYGQNAMPDIFAVFFMAGALYLMVVRSSVLGSSSLFAVALLAKPNIGPFALPFAAWIATDPSGSWPNRFLQLAFWGLLPTLLLGIWLLISRNDAPHVQNLLTLLNAGQLDAGYASFLSPGVWFRLASYPTFFGIGAVGMLALLVSRPTEPIPPRVRWLFLAALLSSMICYARFTRFMWREPQYTLPLLFWLTLFVGLRSASLFERSVRFERARSAFMFAAVVQVMVSALLAMDLKASRAPDDGELRDLRDAVRVSSRVLTLSPSYGASSSIWLGKNTLEYYAVSGSPEASLETFQRLGFSHFVMFDYSLRAGISFRERTWTNVAALQPALVRYLEQQRREIYRGAHSRVFSLTP